MIPMKQSLIDLVAYYYDTYDNNHRSYLVANYINYHFLILVKICIDLIFVGRRA